MSIIDDQMNDELEIGNEQDGQGTTLSSDSFTKPFLSAFA